VSHPPLPPQHKRSNNQRTPSGMRELKSRSLPPGRSLVVMATGRSVFRHPGCGVGGTKGQRPLVIFPHACLDHDTGAHQECSDRLRCA
jgi:hypothetical protein